MIFEKRRALLVETVLGPVSRVTKIATLVMWHIAEVVADPVLTDLHKLERKCLIEVTRHGVCVDESSACYVDAAVQECVADLCKQHAGCTSLQIQSSQP